MKTLPFFLVVTLLTVSCAEGPEKVTVKLAEDRESVPAGEFGYTSGSPSRGIGAAGCGPWNFLNWIGSALNKTRR